MGGAVVELSKSLQFLEQMNECLKIQEFFASKDKSEESKKVEIQLYSNPGHVDPLYSAQPLVIWQ